MQLLNNPVFDTGYVCFIVVNLPVLSVAINNLPFYDTVMALCAGHALH